MIVTKCNDTWSINRWTGLPSEERLSVSLQVFLNTKQIVGDFCRECKPQFANPTRSMVLCKIYRALWKTIDRRIFNTSSPLVAGNGEEEKDRER